jgi:SAM-dependent methyltransferase
MDRWRSAQKYETSYWERTANQIASGVTAQLDWYGWRAGELEKMLQSYLTKEKQYSARILEIGSVPVGIVSFLKWGVRYAIDPLEEFYSSNDTLSALRDPEVEYGKGIGEAVPFDDSYFSFVILDNVLDHVSNASKVLNEISRVLDRNGLMYISVNVHTRWGGLLHSILSKLRIDKGHPYTFTPGSIAEFLKHHKFSISSESVGNHVEARHQDKQSPSLKRKIKGYSGLSEFLYSAVCYKGC